MVSEIFSYLEVRIYPAVMLQNVLWWSSNTTQPCELCVLLAWQGYPQEAQEMVIATGLWRCAQQNKGCTQPRRDLYRPQSPAKNLENSLKSDAPEQEIHEFYKA